ncbi:piggyBac transposable element-derived protein 4-like, partial [Limulus polyphemus]|uniref:PiggyBac transposable element-derived protein 4-like n=1 Tax=Limulus polyphemus TaxID=6850 RepID=A0ABM1SWE2_LIMPO
MKIVEETNRFAHQQGDHLNNDVRKKRRLLKYSDVTLEEILAFIGLTISLGITCLPSVTDYWSTTPSLHFPWFSSIFSREKFLTIARFFHFNDNTNNLPKTNPKHDKLFKVRPVLDHLLTAFPAHYNPSRELFIDEQMLGTKGRISFKQYLPSKPTKWGIKLWVPAEAVTGYCLNFRIYSGKEGSAPSKNLASTVVMTLMEKYLGRGHSLFTDNFYTSPTLFDKLLSLGTYACGTCRKDRAHFPDMFPGKLKRGESQFFSCGSMTAVKWTDKKDVYALSTMHNATVKEVTRRQGDMTNKPQIILDYNKFMEVVDLNDQFLSFYSIPCKNVKWYKKLFFRLVDLSIVNSFILFNQVTKNSKYKQKDFPLQLVESLVKPLIESRGGPSCLSSIRSPVLVDAQERFSPGKHFPAFAEEKK